MGGANREGMLLFPYPPNLFPLTNPRRQGQAPQGSQEAKQGPRRGRPRLPREEARRYDNPSPDTPYKRLTDADEKARKELAAKAGGKGPLNTGNQGIKKSGKK